jgi:hypothetical protein
LPLFYAARIRRQVLYPLSTGLREEVLMMDVYSVAAIVAFFALMFATIAFFETL